MCAPAAFSPFLLLLCLQAREAIGRYQWHNSLLREALPLGLPSSTGCAAAAAAAGEAAAAGQAPCSSSGDAGQPSADCRQQHHAEQQAEGLTAGQQSLAAAVERMGGIDALRELAAAAAEAAAAPAAHPAWQPPMPAAAAAHAYSEQQRRQMAAGVGCGEGLSEQPTRVMLTSLE